MLESDMKLMDAILGRRSIRKFTPQPVDREAVATMLEAARWAPSGLNNQPWRFLVLWAGDPRQKGLSQCTKYEGVVLQAKALIVVFLDRDKTYHAAKDHQGAGACIQNMLLAAHGLGLGSVWLGEIINQQVQVMDTLGLPAEKLELMAVVAVGHPAQQGSSSRHPLETFLLEEF